MFGIKKNTKIATLQLAQEIENGGIKLPHISTLVKALRVTWVKRIVETSGAWQDLAKTELGEVHTEVIWNLDHKSLNI